MPILLVLYNLAFHNYSLMNTNDSAIIFKPAYCHRHLIYIIHIQFSQLCQLREIHSDHILTGCGKVVKIMR